MIIICVLQVKHWDFAKLRKEKGNVKLRQNRLQVQCHVILCAYIIDTITECIAATVTRLISVCLLNVVCRVCHQMPHKVVYAT